MKYLRKRWILVCILVFSFILRTFQLANIPHGFFCDEASIGYNAYKVGTTGKDEYGVTLPFFTQSFGDYRHTLAIYSDIPFIWIFGLNETGVRLQSVFFGMISILVLYFFVKEVTSTKYGLIAAFIAGITPWLLHYNRTGFEFSSYAALFSLTVFLFHRINRNPNYIIPSFITLGITIYTYQPSKLMVPLLLLGIAIIYRKKLIDGLKNTVMGLIIFLLICIPFFNIISSGNATSRFNQVSIFSSKLTLENVIIKSVNQYFFQLSPKMMLMGENTFINRHFAGGLLPLLPITLFFSLIGIIFLFYNFKERTSQLLLFWLFIYPIGGMLVADPPYTSRSIIGAPLAIILSVLGIYSILRLVKNKNTIIVIWGIIMILILFNFSYFLKFYFLRYPLYSSDFWGWQYGPSEIMKYFLSEKDNYDELFMSGEYNAGQIFLVFYDPENKCLSKCKMGDFYTQPNIINTNKKQIFAISPAYLEKSKIKNRFIVKKTIYYPNNHVAFFMGEIKP
jgi:hypothetical protein